MTTAVKRTVVTNSKGYKEVALDFRKARAAALEAANVHTRTNRIHCPALDASLTPSAYGSKALPSTDQTGLEKWAGGLGMTLSEVEGAAYASGPWHKVVSNKWNKHFDESEVNTGFIKSLKRDVHTGILSKGAFDQGALNEFVWAVHPDLKEAGTVMDNAFLHSEAADDLYITSDKLDALLAHNKANSESRLKAVGAVLSKFEMEDLLLKNLGQELGTDSNDDEQKKDAIHAISVRDLHDLYRYGVFPAPTEDKMLASGLIQESSIAMSASSAN